MKDYGLYYSYKGIGDVLIVIFKDEPVTRSETKGRVTIIYHDEEIIGYNIFNVKDIIKIKSEGMIYLPSSTLIDVINTILINAGVRPLDYIDHSGYYTSKVVGENELTLGDKIISAKTDGLKINDIVVVAMPGAHLPNGEIVKENDVHVCTYKDLGINIEEDKILLLDDDMEIGKDFFSMEER